MHELKLPFFRKLSPPYSYFFREEIEYGLFNFFFLVSVFQPIFCPAQRSGSTLKLVSNVDQ